MKPSSISDQEMDGAGPPGTAPGSVESRTAVSRVVPVGPARVRDAATPALGIRRTAIADDDVTTVDGASEALTREQQEALARRVRSELEHTRPIGTPLPSPAQPGAALSERAHAQAFRQTMLLGVARSPSSASPAALPATETPVSEPASLRASFVRVVGPPTSPPPRRPRRTGPPTPPERRPSQASHRVPESEPEHEAFELDRRSSSNLMVNAAPSRSMAPSPPGNGSALILPPPPTPSDYEIAAPETARASSFPPAVMSPGLQQSVTVPRPAHSDSLGELPSVDPFAGFVAQPSSSLERWLVVLVVAFALVGAAALAAIALGYLGRLGG